MGLALAHMSQRIHVIRTCLLSDLNDSDSVELPRLLITNPHRSAVEEKRTETQKIPVITTLLFTDNNFILKVLLNSINA